MPQLMCPHCLERENRQHGLEVRRVDNAEVLACKYCGCVIAAWDGRLTDAILELNKSVKALREN